MPGLKISLRGRGVGFGGELRFFVASQADLAEGGNITELVDDRRIAVREICVPDPTGATVREALFSFVKGTVIEVVGRRVRDEGWHL